MVGFDDGSVSHFPSTADLKLPVYGFTDEQYYREQNAQYEAEAQSIEQSFRRSPDKDDPIMRARHQKYMEYYKMIGTNDTNAHGILTKF